MKTVRPVLAMSVAIGFVMALYSVGLLAQNAPAWVAKSNENAQILITLGAKYGPEGASSEGVQGLDEKISVPGEETARRLRADLASARDELQARMRTEKDPLVRQDLEILIGAADRQMRSFDIERKTFLPYSAPSRLIFFGIKSLLDDQVRQERRPAAVVRLRKYTGLKPGFTPITARDEEYFREKLKTPGLLGPTKLEVEKDLGNTNTYITGIGLLLEKYKMEGYQEAFARLKEQLAEYDRFVRAEVLPKARTDFRLPPEVYRISLENYGVDYAPDDLQRLAHQAFTQIQGQMKEVAARVAKERKLPSSDYRDVIHELKKEQFEGDDITPEL